MRSLAASSASTQRSTTALRSHPPVCQPRHRQAPRAAALPPPRCQHHLDHHSSSLQSSVACRSRVGSSSSGSRGTSSRSGRMASAYDNPAIYSNDDAFSERTYWDRRYQQDPTTFEWYRSWDSLKPILTRHLPLQQPILQLGVGTSRLQEDMADDGYSSILSVDYSPVAIERLQQTYAARPQLQYAVEDARSMPQYADASYGGVLDKGTLDALLCGDDDERAASQLLGEVWRLLAPGCAYVMITSAAPKSRLKYLQTPATPWQQLVVYEVGQQGAMAGPFSCDSNGAAGSAAPADGLCGGLQDALQLPRMGYSHLVYVCYKPS